MPRLTLKTTTTAAERGRLLRQQPKPTWEKEKKKCFSRNHCRLFLGNLSTETRFFRPLLYNTEPKSQNMKATPLRKQRTTLKPSTLKTVEFVQSNIKAENLTCLKKDPNEPD